MLKIDFYNFGKRNYLFKLCNYSIIPFECHKKCFRIQNINNNNRHNYLIGKNETNVENTIIDKNEQNKIYEKTTKKVTISKKAL